VCADHTNALVIDNGPSQIRAVTDGIDHDVPIYTVSADIVSILCMYDCDNDTDLACILPIDNQQDNKQTKDVDGIQELNKFLQKIDIT